MKKQIWFSILSTIMLLGLSVPINEVYAANEKGSTKCNDGADNDGDGKVDGEDEDCFGAFKPDRDDNSGRGKEMHHLRAT